MKKKHEHHAHFVPEELHYQKKEHDLFPEIGRQEHFLGHEHKKKK